MFLRLFLILFLSATVLTASAAPIKVVSLSTILTEVAQKVGGEKIQVVGLVKPLTDPHDFEPKPGDIAEIASAQLILASGKRMEGYLTKLEQSSGTTGRFIEVGALIPSLQIVSEAHGAIEDPHWWHSVANVILAVDIVRDELIKADPGNAATYRENAVIYGVELKNLQKAVKIKIASLPRDRRKLVTSHDAFQYFAREYGFTIYPIEGVSPDAEPTNRQVVAMIAEIKKQGVKAIFVEAGANPKVTEEIARESGAKVCGTLVADGLGTGKAGTYLGLIQSNVDTIVDALK